MAETIVQKYIGEDFISKNVKDYALYVLRTRALPNIMDGLRVGARKILYATIKDKSINPSSTTDNPEIKTVTTIGETMKLEWGHGDASLKNTIEKLSMDHLNEFNPLEIEGQIGTLRVPKVNTAARYLMTRRTENLKLYEHSSKLWKIKIEENSKVEPHYFTPILPMTLLYRTNAPGFGFSFSCFSYNVEHIISAMLTTLHYGTCEGLRWSKIEPHVIGIKSENIIFNHNINSYFNIGEYELIAANKMRITDLPYDISYENYEKYLDKLVTEGYIVKWENLTRGNDTDFVLVFAPNRLKVLVKQKLKFFKKLKLYKKIPKDTLNVLDQDGKTIINFTDIRTLIAGFVNRRLVVYRDFKQNKIELLTETIEDFKIRIKFIQLFLDDKIELRKRDKDDIVKQCKLNDLDISEYIDDLFSN